MHRPGLRPVSMSVVAIVVIAMVVGKAKPKALCLTTDAMNRDVDGPVVLSKRPVTRQTRTSRWT